MPAMFTYLPADLAKARLSKKRHLLLMTAVRLVICFFFSSRRRHTRLVSDWSSDVCSSDLFCDLVTNCNDIKPIQFYVIAIGDEVTKVKSGDTIYMDKHYGAEIEHEKEKYLVIDESSILAKLD